MELEYASDKLKLQCTKIDEAMRLLGGNRPVANSLLARINALKQATTIKDITVQPQFHFHNLQNKNGKNLDGYFAIDARGRNDPWRIIIQPLNENRETYVPCHIDEIADKVRIIMIEEVSKHYE